MVDTFECSGSSKPKIEDYQLFAGNYNIGVSV